MHFFIQRILCLENMSQVLPIVTCLALVFLPGVAFSKHIVHIYAYNGGSDLRQHLEVRFNLLEHYLVLILSVFRSSIL